jgi:hypothetical protein
VTDDEFLAEVVAACRRVDNAEAVALGGVSVVKRTELHHDPCSSAEDEPANPR